MEILQHNSIPWITQLLYWRLGVGCSVSSAIWQQFIDKVLENIPSSKIYKIIIGETIIFSTQKQHFEDPVNLFIKVLIKFGLKISPHICQFFRDDLM